MYERKIPLTLDCGLDLLREVLGGKWKISLLYFVGQGLRRPSQLHKQLPDATRRVLQQQLRQLVEHDLLWKQPFPGRTLKVEYHLTELGESLLPLIHDLGQWGDTHQEHLRRVIVQRLNLTT
jgi:DNA-binding HxlR family transcriptional regulator